MLFGIGGTAVWGDVAILDPPLGTARLEMTNEMAVLTLADGETHAAARSTVTASNGADCEIEIDWNGTPILVGCGTASNATRLFEHLGGFASESRFFDIVVNDPSKSVA